ncbi:MAG: hypothetical protein HN712_12775 [Gemmatimonadetes bacterium]|jgi:uncharacterized protein|nr:hypothetical protein [Gemmatimonadota bacterium]
MFSATADVARCALEAGVDPHATDENGNTALLCVVEAGDIQLIHALVTAGVDIGVRNADGDTALSLATANDFGEVVELLKSSG